jgi:hypothetical protein
MQFTNGWLAFELSVLQRLKFASIALPLTGEPNLGIQLKHLNVKICANDPMMWAYTKAVALIENTGEVLTENDLSLLLDEAYVPRESLDNETLLKWFNPTDAWWFDNVRFNAETLSPFKRALALTLGMMVGDYVLAFNADTRSLREPLFLSKAFHLMLQSFPFVQGNNQGNRSTNLDVRSFIAESHSNDLMFLRLPAPLTQGGLHRDSYTTWKEEWLRGGDDFWPVFEKESGARLGSRVQSKQQYLGFVDDLLRTASHIPSWAIAHTENGFISTEELVENISRVRKVHSVYSKDFSDLLGVKASVIVSSS